MKKVSLFLVLIVLLSILPSSAYTESSAVHVKGVITLPQGSNSSNNLLRVFFVRDNGKNGNYIEQLVGYDLKNSVTTLNYEFNAPLQSDGYRVRVFLTYSNGTPERIVPQGILAETYLALDGGIPVYNKAFEFGKVPGDYTINVDLPKIVSVKGVAALKKGTVSDKYVTVVVSAVDAATGNTIVETIDNNGITNGKSELPFSLGVPVNSPDYVINYWLTDPNIGGVTYNQSGSYVTNNESCEVGKPTRHVFSVKDGPIENLSIALYRTDSVSVSGVDKETVVQTTLTPTPTPATLTTTTASTTTISIKNSSGTKLADGAVTSGNVSLSVSGQGKITKSITLNGKTVKWPTSNKLSAKGKYVVTVKDAANKIYTMKFTIK